MRTGFLKLVLGSVAVCAACSTAPQDTASPSPPAADQSAYAPVLSLNQIMVAVVDSHSHEIWDAAVTPPTTDEGWASLEHAAATLAAAGSLTRLSGNGPDDRRWLMEPDWDTHSQALSDAGLAVFRAVNAKDSAALNSAGDRLVLACIECHKANRLDVPRIWSDHEHVLGTVQ